MKETAFHKYALIYSSVDSTGDNIYNAKNTKHAFDAYELENAS